MRAGACTQPPRNKNGYRVPGRLLDKVMLSWTNEALLFGTRFWTNSEVSVRVQVRRVLDEDNVRVQVGRVLDKVPGQDGC